MDEKPKRTVQEILIARMTMLFDTTLVDSDRYTYVCVNVNSLMNVLTHDELLDYLKQDKKNFTEFAQEVTSALRLFLLNNISRKVMFYYSMEKRVSNDYIDNFRIDQIEKYNDTYVKYLFEHLLKILNKLRETLSFMLINTARVEPSVFIHSIVGTMKNDIFLIMTRDPMDFILLSHDNVMVFDSNVLMEGGEKFKNHHSRKLPKIDPRLLSIYYRVRGIPRFKYIGVKGKGEARAIQWISDNITDIMLHNSIYQVDDSEYDILDYSRHINIGEVARKIHDLTDDFNIQNSKK